MLKRLPAICSAVILAAFASCALAEGERVHSYTLVHSGELRLTAPDSWQGEIKKDDKSKLPTVEFRPASGHGFQVLVTTIVPTVGDSTPNPGQNKLRALIESARAGFAPEAVEKYIVIHKLRGPNAAGYYFTATDKAPGSGPDDFRIMTHYEVAVGRALLLVTAFYNDDSSKVRERTLSMLERAQFKPGDLTDAQNQGNAGDQGADAGQGIKVSKIAAGYSITVPASRLELILHGKNLKRQPGGSASPGYFFFDDNGKNAIISGWFDPASDFPGIKPFWKGESGSMKDHQPPGPQNVKFETIGKWQVVAYDIKLPVANTSNVHLRAERVQAGTWIDLHLSMTSKLSSAEAHAKLLDVLKSIEVREKAK